MAARGGLALPTEGGDSKVALAREPEVRVSGSPLRPPAACIGGARARLKRPSAAAPVVFVRALLWVIFVLWAAACMAGNAVHERHWLACRAGGVKNATHRYDLPPPPLAVRNLVHSLPSCLITVSHPPRAWGSPAIPHAAGVNLSQQDACMLHRPGDTPAPAAAACMHTRAGAPGAVCAPVHGDERHAPPAGGVPLRHARGLCGRRGGLPHLLPVPAGHPHAQYHGGPALLPGRSNARLDGCAGLRHHHMSPRSGAGTLFRRSLTHRMSRPFCCNEGAGA